LELNGSIENYKREGEKTSFPRARSHCMLTKHRANISQRTHFYERHKQLLL